VFSVKGINRRTNFEGVTMEDLFTWKGPRAKARRNDPRTSLEAADSVKRIRESQQVILEVLLAHSAGLTDEQIFACLRPGTFSPSGARSRRHELVERGLVKDSERRERTKSGRQTIVWVAL